MRGAGTLAGRGAQRGGHQEGERDGDAVACFQHVSIREMPNLQPNLQNCPKDTFEFLEVQ
jgi:hypothetical protein